MNRGLFLDLDGTLANSHGMLARCFERLLASLRVPPDGPSFQDMAAFTLPDIVARLCRGRDDADPAALLKTYEGWVLEGYVTVQPHAGARALLQWARAQDIRTAVVTSAAEASSIRWLDAHGLMDDLGFVIGRDSVTRTKPDPEPYQIALARAGCDPARSAAIEDSASGATSAQSAGLPTFVLGSKPDDLSRWPDVQGWLPTLLDVRAHFA